MNTRTTRGTVLTLLTVPALIAIATPAAAVDQTTTTDSTLTSVGGVVVEENALAESDGEGYVAETGGTTVEIPGQAQDQIVVTDDDAASTDFTIDLPDSNTQTAAQPSSLGGVTYDTGDDSTTTVLPKNDGSVQIVTVLESADAPTDYTYTITGSEGSYLQLQDDGSVALLSTDGDWEGGIAAPWAKDANGDAVETSYSVDGNTLTQHVSTTADTKFPVVADPWWGINYIDHTEWADLWEWSPTLKVYPTFWGRIAGADVGWVVWMETLYKTEREGHPDPDTSTMRHQFYCHYDFVRIVDPDKESWNLDTRIPDKGYLGFLASRCN
ncbi:MAG: DUF2599 domain-containing protein [Actinomyces ruminicola]|nr:DUF2599 domain-containing protein [Actinomyces ruminicola]